MFLRGRMRSQRLWVVAVFAGGAAVAAGVTYAAIPDSTGVIHGCYSNAQGGLRVIDTGKGEQCKSAETALNWNQTGPQGAEGATGAKGPTGATGAQGPAGLGAQYLAADLTSPVGDPSQGSVSAFQEVAHDFGVFNGVDVLFSCYSNNNGGDSQNSGAELTLNAVNGVQGDAESFYGSAGNSALTIKQPIVQGISGVAPVFIETPTLGTRQTTDTYVDGFFVLSQPKVGVTQQEDGLWLNLEVHAVAGGDLPTSCSVTGTVLGVDGSRFIPFTVINR